MTSREEVMERSAAKADESRSIAERNSDERGRLNVPMAVAITAGEVAEDRERA